MPILDNLSTMGRRKKGYSAPEGLIRQLGSPYWYIKIGAFRKSTKTADLKKATYILRRVQVKLMEKEDRIAQMLGISVPFTQVLERYLREVTPRKRSSRSDHLNAKALRKFKIFTERKIDGITEQDIYKFQDWRKAQFVQSKKAGKEPTKPISGATVNREIALLQAVFKKACRWGYLSKAKNPAVRIELLEENKRERYITDEEMKAIKAIAWATPRAGHLPDVINVLYYTGQRSGRILNLRWPQIDLKDRSITFEQTSRNKRVPDILYINDPLLKILTRLKKERSLQRVISPYVFAKRDGSPYGSLKMSWNHCCEKAGVKDAHIHDIRHKTASDLRKMGFSFTDIMEVLAHKDAGTSKRYTHFSLESSRIPLEALGTRGIV